MIPQVESMPSGRDPLEVIADEFCRRRRNGESPTIEEYVAKYPELVDDIRALFPTLQWIENLRPDESQATGSQSSTALEFPEPPAAIGEFRIVREIGRGGMGIVYEAEQPSLGRHVALKILPRELVFDDRQRKRFECEALAAARLHHTNIVPVFGTGQQNGIYYYVMQYINGLSLDAVVSELRQYCSSSKVDLPSNEDTHVRSEPSSTVRGADRGISNHKVNGGIQKSEMVSLLLGPGRDIRQGRLPAGYYRSVAGLGAQAADALQYAHQQGVLHRDIKPSNLLLDSQGTVWITDFGLAKLDDQQSLTRAGDIVGTVRYMAPEMFRGDADPKSDIYSLGLTLYELVAQRPAFEARNRAQLMRRIFDEPLPLLRTVEPSVPSDLATIIHKSVEHEAASRYQSAAELRDDLRRFLANEPIHARRMAALARFLRWCRRNPAIATLTTTIIGLLVTGLVAAILVALHLNRVVQGRQQAEVQAKRRLYDSLIAQGKVSLFSGRPGRRFDSLAAIGQASQLISELDLDDEQRLILRNEAISAMASPDVANHLEWALDDRFQSLDSIDFDPTLSQYVESTSDALVVRRTSGNEIVARLSGGERQPAVSRFSPNGKLLGVGYESSQGNDFRLWDLDKRQTLLRVEGQIWKLSIDFSRDNQWLAIGHRSGLVEVYSVADSSRVASLEVGTAPFSVRWRPNSETLAISCTEQSKVILWEPFHNVVRRTLQHPAEMDVHGIAWDPSGMNLASACEQNIYLWNVEDADVPKAVLKGHTWLVHDVTYHPRGDFLVSHGWAGKTYLWNVRSMRQVLEIDGHFSRFNANGTQLAFRTGTRLGIWKVSVADECLTMYPTKPSEIASENPLNLGASFSPKLPLAVTCGESVVLFWETLNYRRLAAMSLGSDVTSCLFDPAADAVWVSSAAGVLRFPLETDTNLPGQVRLGPPRKLPLPEKSTAYSMAMSQNGRVLAVVLLREGRVVVWDVQRLETQEPMILTGSANIAHVTVSPDGRWIVCGRQNDAGFEIWDASTGNKVKTLETSGSGITRFSPDGRSLVTATGHEYRFWNVHDWSPSIAVPREDVPTGGYLAAGAMAFTPDGRILALTKNQYRVLLVDTRTGKELATLEQAAPTTIVNWMTFNSDGSRLWVCCARDGSRLWNIRLVREQLSLTELDWESPSLPPLNPVSGDVKLNVDETGMNAWYVD